MIDLWQNSKVNRQELLIHSDMFVNNQCEVFNSSIKKYRDIPIIIMFKKLYKSGKIFGYRNSYLPTLLV